MSDKTAGDNVFAVTPFDERTFVSLVEFDMVEGNKRTTSDLHKYCEIRRKELSGTWRHRESGEVYETVGLGLAATGSGKLVLMVRYIPFDNEHYIEFERQHVLFVERFERVRPTTVWEKAL